MRSTQPHPSQHQLSDLARGGQPGSAPIQVRSGLSARRTDAETTPSKPNQNQAFARAHLRDGCPRCAAALRQAARDESPALRELIRQTILADEEPNREAFSELAGRTVAWATLLDAEQAAAVELEESLLAMPPGERAEAVRTGNRYRTLGLIHHLMDHARDEGVSDPAQARCLAELAVEAAESIDERSYPTPMVAEARALAWAVLGNALRRISDLYGSERAFHSARSHLEAASIHPVIHADVETLLASLRIDQTRYSEAIEILDRTACSYELFAEPQSEARALIKMSLAEGENGNPARSVVLLEKAESLLDPEEDQELLLVARQGRVARLNEAGRAQEAAELLEELTPEFKAAISDFRRVQRLHWVGAKIAHSLGDVDRAEAGLMEVRQQFEEREEAYDFAIVTLDLAILYAEQGRTSEVRSLAKEMLPIFTSRRIHQHALAALVLFQRAAEAEKATVAYVRDLALFLHRARNNPYLALDTVC